MSLEIRNGFRSSFNLVPEWEYRVPDALRERLASEGFEVGVHGLQHDGKLYSSKASFQKRAARIREYLRAWNASGFRSPFMQHKLAWLHELSAEYDASTFDTDPFEPEPHGVRTIFPFWVPGPNGGFVELPYTLVQDFTLFQVLGEKTIDIWKRKLDWVAEKGGMVLLNTHPDYMCFGGKKARDEFPVELYEELLQYVREKYEGAYWAALPRDVARYYTSAIPEPERNTRRKVCMVAHTAYQGDNRVRRYAESLAKRGDDVDVIALTWWGAPRGRTELSGVHVFGVQPRVMNEGSKWVYAWRLLRFLAASSALLTWRHRRIGYDLIHVHNVPDFLVFSAWYPKWTGAKVILDIHDIVPELFASKFAIHAKSVYVKGLKLIEKASCAFADHVIVSNHLWFERLTTRSVPAPKCSVFVNNVDPAIFYRRPRTRNDDRIILLFPGTFQWHQGLDVAVRALVDIRKKFPTAELHLYGGGGGRGAEPGLKALAEELGIAESVKFCGSVPLDRIPEVIANADIGVVPKRADSFGNEAYSTKILEFMSQGVPVVASRTKIDSFYFDDTTLRFFPSGDAPAMAEAIISILENPELRASLVTRGFESAERDSWRRKKLEYLDLVDALSTEVFHSPAAPERAAVTPGSVAR